MILIIIFSGCITVTCQWDLIYDFPSTVSIQCQFGLSAQTGVSTKNIFDTYKSRNTVIFSTRINIEAPCNTLKIRYFTLNRIDTEISYHRRPLR